MSNQLVTLVKLDTVHLYLDNNKKILIFDILSSSYSNNDSSTVLEYFKHFWLLAKEKNIKYYMIVKINQIGIYPINFYSKLINYLTELNYIFVDYLHSCCFLCPSNNPLNILRPLFSVYNLTRPFSVFTTYEDILNYFKKPENNIK